MPSGWNKTHDDLINEMIQGKRLFATAEEDEWASQYERSLLPPGVVFPRSGQIWEATVDCEVTVLLYFAAPAGGSEQAILRQGERVRIEDGIGPEPIRVGFLPVRYEELHERLVSAADRLAPRYSNYALSAKTDYFNRHFRLVEDMG